MKFTKESLVRAIRTFVQSSLAYILVNIALVDFSSDMDAIKATLLGLLISALAGGISAVMNMEDRENDI